MIPKVARQMSLNRQVPSLTKKRGSQHEREIICTLRDPLSSPFESFDFHLSTPINPMGRIYVQCTVPRQSIYRTQERCGENLKLFTEQDVACLQLARVSRQHAGVGLSYSSPLQLQFVTQRKILPHTLGLILKRRIC